MMEVKVISYTPDALKLVSACARTCYNSRSKDNDKNRETFIAGLVKAGHESPLENVSITFDVSGVSRALLAQITRHRVGASFCVQSQRYVTYNLDKWVPGVDYVVPPYIKGNYMLNKSYETFMNANREAYKHLVLAGAKAEDARMVLPQAFCTAFTLTLNVRALRHILQLRLNHRAQWEIREFAHKLLEEARKVFGDAFFADIVNTYSQDIVITKEKADEQVQSNV